MNTNQAQCVLCDKQLPFGARFCPYCGAIQQLTASKSKTKNKLTLAGYSFFFSLACLVLFVLFVPPTEPKTATEDGGMSFAMMFFCLWFLSFCLSLILWLKRLFVFLKHKLEGTSKAQIPQQQDMLAPPDLANKQTETIPAPSVELDKLNQSPLGLKR